MAESPPIVPLTMQSNDVILGYPARQGNTWVWSDVRIPYGQHVIADPALPIPQTNQPGGVPGNSPEEDSLPGGSPVE